MSETKIINDYTKGRLPGQMLRFSLPFMLSNALQVLYSVVDMIVVGNVVGSAGISAVATSSQVVTFMTMLCLGFSTGGQVHISHLIGAKRTKELSRSIGTLFFIVLSIGVIMTVLGLSLCPTVLKIMQTPEESFKAATSYLYICSGGIIFTYGYNVVSAVLRGMGNSKQPCIFIVIAALINLVLDIVFVIYFGWGVAGAAAATVIGQAVSFIWAIIYLFRHRAAFGFDFRPRSFIPEKAAFTRLCSLGVPFAMRSAMVNISMMFVTSLVNSVSVAASAVFGVGLKVDDVVRKISMGVNYSVSTMVGQNFAAGEYTRTKRAVYWGWFYSFLIYLVFFIVYILNIEALFRLFTADTAVLELAPVFVRAIIWSFPAMILMRGANGFIQGMGFSKMSFVFALIDGFILRIGMSWFLGVVCGMGLFGFFLGYGLATYGTSIPGTIYFLSGRWKRAKLC